MRVRADVDGGTNGHLFIIGGWIVAGLVTLLGVLLAHWVQERGWRRQEDRVGIHEPLLKEMLRIKEEARLVKDGYFLWTPREVFNDILHRGVVRPKRHDDLRKDVERLTELHDKHDVAHSACHKARESAIQGILETEQAKDDGKVTKLADILGRIETDDELLRALASNNEGRWSQRLENPVVGARERFPSGKLVTPAKTLYEQTKGATIDWAAGGRTASSSLASAVRGEAGQFPIFRLPPDAVDRVFIRATSISVVSAGNATTITVSAGRF